MKHWTLSMHMTLKLENGSKVLHPSVLHGLLGLGTSEGVMLGTIETLYVGDIQGIAPVTNMMDTVLSSPRYGCRAAQYREEVIVIGGFDPFDESKVNVIVDDVLYILGGLNNNNINTHSVDTYQYIELQLRNLYVYMCCMLNRKVAHAPTSATTENPSTSSTI
eukprot:273512_1